MKLDRELQLEILRALRDKYPDSVEWGDFDFPEFSANYMYLEEHGLIRSFENEVRGRELCLRITAEGLDFLEDDGGVGAVLRTFTVKLNPDDLRALMAARIESSNLPAEEKSSLAHAIRSLPAQALRDLTTRLVNEAVNQWPGALQLFQTYVTP